MPVALGALLAREYFKDEAITAAVADNQGHTVIAAGKALSDAQILNMNWLVQGVQGKLTP